MRIIFKDTIGIILKIIVSGLIAFFILTGFCSLYYNLPIKQANLTGATDYKWESNYKVSRFTEGISFNLTNNEGFTNSFDYDDSLDIFCLVMGSSHMESLNVNSKEYTSYLLNEKDDNIYYNIGISGHNFLVCVDNLEAALKTYKPKVVVIETASLIFDEKSIDDAINHNRTRTKADYDRIVELLESNQFFRIMYHQLNNYKVNILNKDVTSVDSKVNDNATNKLLSYISEIANTYNTDVLIVYHPTTSLNADGTINIENIDVNNTFNKTCDAYGLYYLDMSNRFVYEYNVNHVLPYGFVNTKVGVGHFNKYGHALMADEIYKVLKEID